MARQKIEITEYRASVHVGLCLGPLDSVNKVFIKEKDSKFSRATALTKDMVKDWNLFGGVKKEGGVDGMIYYLPGDAGQTLPDLLAIRLGLTSETSPAYRGISSLWFTGLTDALNNTSLMQIPGKDLLPTMFERVPMTTDGTGNSADDIANSVSNPFGVNSGTSNFLTDLFGINLPKQTRYVHEGFMWGLSPQLPSVWAEVTYIPKGLNTVTATIIDPDSPNTPDAGAAHIIYECLTDPDFGMGYPPESINTDNFNSVAQVLYNEAFGLSFEWQRSETVESFIQDVLDHIQANLYINPRSGLWELKLIRGDYDPETLPQFDENNCVIQNFQRRGFGEITNEVVVSYTDRTNEQSLTIGTQELSAVAAQGGRIVSVKKDYYGIRSHKLASTVLQRDLRSLSAPLAGCDLIMNRKAWDVAPGSCIRLSSEEHGFSNVVYRVVKVSYGTIKSGAVRVSVVEDIFGLDYGNWYEAVNSGWGNESEAPRDFDYVQMFTIPSYLYPQIVNEEAQNADFIDALEDATETDLSAFRNVVPKPVVGIFSANDGFDTFEYDLRERIIASTGDVDYSDLGTRATIARGVTTTELVSEATSLWNPTGMTPGDRPQPGSFVMFGQGDDGVMEIAKFRALNQLNNGTVVWTLDRGTMDTVPAAWPAGTPFWIFSTTTPFDDDSPRVAGDTATFKLLPRTSQGTLEEEDAAEQAYVISDRVSLPLRPANVKVNGQGFGEADVRDDPVITVTWANRNRLTETGEIVLWTDAGEAPEDGQTTTIEIFTIDRDLVTTIDGLTGESYVFNEYDFAGLGLVIVRFTSERGGKKSLQGHELLVRVLSGGYGYSYGFAYGGNA